MRIEIRADKKSLTIEGYVNAVGRESRIMTDKNGEKFTEIVEPGAFNQALGTAKSIRLMHNHERDLGATDTGELELREDKIGLYAKATTTDEVIIEKAQKDELRGWSFGFYPLETRYEKTETIPRRHLRKILLVEVSIIDNSKFPAYVGTSIEARAEEGETLKEIRVSECEGIEIKEQPQAEEKKKYDNTKYKNTLQILKMKGEI